MIYNAEESCTGINFEGSTSNDRLKNIQLAERRFSEIHEITACQERRMDKYTLLFHDREIERDFQSYMMKNHDMRRWRMFLIVYVLIGFVYFGVEILQQVLEKAAEKLIVSNLMVCFFAWILPTMSLFIFTFLKSDMNIIFFGVLLNWLTNCVGLIGRFYYLNPDFIDLSSMMMFFSTIFLFHGFNYIPFLISVMSIMISFIYLGVACFFKGYMKQYTFIYSLLFSLSIIIVICHQREKRIRSDFFKTQFLHKLKSQLKNLKRSYLEEKPLLESPLETSILLIRSLLADIDVTESQVEILNEILCLLNSSNLFTPDLRNEISKGTIKLDDQQQKWLFSEVMKHLEKGTKRRKSVPSIYNFPSTEGKFNIDEIVFNIQNNETVSNEVTQPTLGMLLRKREHKCKTLMSCKSKSESVIYAGNNLPIFNSLDKLSHIFDKIDHWGFPIFEMNELCDHRPLSALSIYLFKKLDLFKSLKIPIDTFLNFISFVENGYRKDIPYHNSLHASDVLHASYYFYANSKIRNMLEDFDLFCLFYSSIVHDYDHPGVNNNFLTSCLDEKAILYNDRSVLENHHLSSSFQLLLKPENNFVSHFSESAFKDFRENVIESVLATDLSKHFEILASFKSKLPTLSETIEEKESQLLISKIIIKSADICNSAKPFHLHQKWVNLVLEEFLYQGDKERELSMPVTPHMNRQSVNVASIQSGFISFICLPLFESLHSFAEIPTVYQYLEMNQNYWKLKSDVISEEDSVNEKENQPPSKN